MSKIKLALFIFTLAFGVNIAAFLFSKKAYVVEEVKSIWIYELPLTASPLDAYSAQDLGPAQGVVGTLLMPAFESGVGSEVASVPLLADQWEWDEAQKKLSVTLKPGLTYADQTPILAEHFVQSANYIKSQMKRFSWTDEWKIWLNATVVAPTPLTLIYTFSDWKESAKNLNGFMRTVFSHPLTGVIHPANLEALQKGEKINKKWISSGPYRVRKWDPKEIILVSRDDFPVRMQKEFFRTLRYQSSPVKNPSCEFSQAERGEALPSKEHRVVDVDEVLHVYWICRSWAEAGSFCSKRENREALSGILSGASVPSSMLQGQTLRYRIPFGSDAFRDEVTQKINKGITQAGGKVQETSYFFKPSTETDLELLFVATPGGTSLANSENFALLSSRMGQVPDAVAAWIGVVATFPMEIFMKNMKGKVFEKVFLLPDLEEKKILSI